MYTSSVVIPTYNMAPALDLTLEALCRQTIGAEHIEVIVVDDGSTDNTKAICEKYANRLALRYVFQQNQGQGNARNNGLSYVTSPITVFLGADTIGAPSLLAEHLRVHEQYPAEQIGCLGFATWDPAVGITPLMYFLEHGGHQFAYDKAQEFPRYQGGEFPAVPYQFFYTINISFKTTLLRKEQFLPAFTKYGWEDIELGHRLSTAHGFQLLYNAQAKALHHDHITEARWRDRMKNIAKNGVFFERLCPGVRVMPHGMKKIIFHLLSWAPHIWFWKLAKTIVPHERTHFMYYYSLMKRLTFQGMHQARAELADVQKAHTM